MDRLDINGLFKGDASVDSWYSKLDDIANHVEFRIGQHRRCIDSINGGDKYRLVVNDISIDPAYHLNEIHQLSFFKTQVNNFMKTLEPKRESAQQSVDYKVA